MGMSYFQAKKKQQHGRLHIPTAFYLYDGESRRLNS